MIRPLRKYHFVIWRILAIALPILFVAAIWLRPASDPNYLRLEKDFSFDLLTLTDSTAQLTIDVRNPLRVPSCVIYASFSSKDILLGKLDHRGSYHFEIERRNEEAIHIRLYDAIHKHEIANVTVKENNN